MGVVNIQRSTGAGAGASAVAAVTLPVGRADRRDLSPPPPALRF